MTIDRIYRLSMLLAFLAGFSTKSRGQSTVPINPEAKIRLQEQASNMVQAIVAFDFETYVDYLLPRYVELEGGREALILSMRNDAKMYQADGTRFSDGRVHKTSPFLTCNKQIQCVLRQEITMTEARQAPFVMEVNLVAVSADNGLNWKFYSAGGDDLQTLRKTFPEFCKDLPFERY